MKSSQVTDYLYANKIKPSFTRIKIFQYLNNHDNHPTVDEIYLAVIKEIPTLSKTTVYNTLKLFMSHKIVKLISIEDTETRYEINLNTHGHFKCTQCGRIQDFDINIDSLNIKPLDDFIIEEKNVYFKGVCALCLKKNVTNTN